MNASWKTTTLGILVLLAAVLHVAMKMLRGEPITPEDLSFLGLGAAGGAGLVAAKDHDK